MSRGVYIQLHISCFLRNILVRYNAAVLYLEAQTTIYTQNARTSVQKVG